MNFNPPLSRFTSLSKGWSSPLVLCLGLAAFIACDDDASNAGDSGAGGETGPGGNGANGGGGGDAGSSSGDGGAEANGGSSPSGGSEGLAGGGAAGEGPDGSGGGAPVDACVAARALAPPLARWTAYVVENEFGETTLWAAKSGAPGKAISLHESENSITPLRWSPDGRWLAFVDQLSSYDSRLYVIDFSGEKPPQVIPVAPTSDELQGSPSWSPDSNRLVYAEPYVTFELRQVDFSTGVPGEPVVFGSNCPQGAYSDLPCLGSFVHPLVLDWSPNGDDLAGVFVSTFYAESSTGSATDLFLLRPDEPETAGTLASPFVPSFDPARRGVSPETFVWSPDGARVAYAGSFEDTSAVTEAYVFDVSDGAATPIKLHADLAEPHEGARQRMAWVSETTVVFASDLNSPAEHGLFAIDVSTPNAVAFPAPETLLSASGGSVLAFALSPDRSSVLVLRQTSEDETANLTVFPYESAPLPEPLEISAAVTAVGGSFSASAQWSADSRLVAFVEQNDGATGLAIAGLLPDGSSCVVTSFEVDSPSETWRWLADESSLVVLDATGVHRLHAGSESAENLSAPLEPNESISEWAVQPRGGIE